eukprot:TRINITY_DN7942_c0_g1_i1.p1 TRINITY_DN7942_c0_g1~~TRINITY_DN7942_c0_g1_i1.p1  ORF type:complete len:281 (-),score=44.55 TRINITY_DN7942_c0_g1_i1:148-990(-)
MQSPSEELFPIFYLSHGGGPCFFMEDSNYPISAFDKNSEVAKWYRNFEQNFVPKKPKSIIIVSAHWEETSVHITSNPAPNLYFDYYGFPRDTYSLQYPAKCDVDLAIKLQSKFSSAGIPAVLDPSRDWDHGVFVPLLLMFPEANIPLVQISLKSTLSAEDHIKIGKVLGDPVIRKDSIIIGSGFATHNLRVIFQGSRKSLIPWVGWLTRTITSPDLTKEEREKLLINWTSAPDARYFHPREEHLLPLHVCLGASSGGQNEEIYDFVMDDVGVAFSSYKFS